MCTVTKCGCGQSSSDSIWATIGGLILGFVVGLFWLVRHVVAPAAMIAAVLAWRWLSGSAMTGKARQATFMRGSVPPARPVRRFVRRIHWAHWPGYQRAIMRWVLTGLAVSAYLYPLATALTGLAVLAAALTARYRHSIVERFRADVIRVRVEIVHRPAPALTAHADAPVWSASSAEAVTR